MDKINGFAAAVRTDPKANELIRSLPVPKSDAEAIQGYQQVAKALGFDMTGDDIVAALKVMEADQKAATAKVSLSDDALENVAGGYDGEEFGELCNSTFKKGEWCWFSDYCAYVINDYDDVIMKRLEDRARADGFEFKKVCSLLDLDNDTIDLNDNKFNDPDIPLNNL